MKKKTFGRIAALSIAALTAVPTFSIVASAEVSVTSAWRIPVSKDVYGSFTYAYYNSKAEADAANLYTDSATGNKIAPVSVTSIPNIKVGDAIHIDSSGKILPGAATAGTIAGKWGGSSSSGSSTGSGIFNTAYHYAEPQT
ncbi:MAG: hypothetical protein K2G04_01195 [Oscillospiraceae bacterium]|nr:hypothetical protein [Oscillospiraceae bacterium]